MKHPQDHVFTYKEEHIFPWYCIVLGHRWVGWCRNLPMDDKYQCKFVISHVFKCQNFHMKLHNFLRVFMGFLRGFYGFSTATDFFTGFLRPKTWFLRPRPKMNQNGLNCVLPGFTQASRSSKKAPEAQIRIKGAPRCSRLWREQMPSPFHRNLQTPVSVDVL